MPHDVAVPEESAEVRSSTGEINRMRFFVVLELHRRALTHGAKLRRRPTRTIPLPSLRRNVLPISGEMLRVHGQSDEHRWSA